MLKELNSIFAGLLGLQGYPVSPPVTPSRLAETLRVRVPAARAGIRTSRAGAGRLARSPAWLGVRR
ncbi:MAG: hypothetical protein EOP90_12650 [Lysobacteraceae bacterium]|nr:MAG: hypothetical protein EOP90_12650 [Xanthomonadaceae bacterium]